MADLSGVNYAKEIAKPSLKIENGEVFGSVHYLREEYALAGAVLAIGDTISGPMLPKGARVIDAAVKVSASLGTGGILDLGYLASADAVEVADPNAFVIGADAGGQAVLSKAAIASAGLDKKFDAPVRTQAIMTEASSATTGVTVSFWIAYVLN